MPAASACVIDADESLRKIGVVHVARTVLRLVLQNLIINASDAVRDAGKERGTLRVSAAVVHDLAPAAAAATGGTAARVPRLRRPRNTCTCSARTTASASPQDNLERVFEKGFSTKSRGTNYGIGLHWCANAISALGGRMWAASDGPGRGASMHLVLPLTSRRARAGVEAA